jgi:hypothetical protein
VKSKYDSIADWNVSLWFAPLSPAIGILLASSEFFSSSTEKRHKDENDKPQANQGRKTTEMVSTASPLARSDAGVEHVDLQFRRRLESHLQSASRARKRLVLTDEHNTFFNSRG